MFRYFFVIILFCASCKSTTNFTDSQGPVWMNKSISEVQHSDVTAIRALTYNIQYSKKIKEAIHEFESFPLLRDLDILFLQEMDSLGVKFIAEALDYNSVYYPASTHGKQHQYFGNAILSKWPIKNSNKIILPHLSMSKRQRIAVGATIKIGNQDIQVINVHLETMTMKRKKRLDQVKEIIRFANTYYSSGPLIIAGDFNSFFPKDRRQFSALMTEAGLDWVNREMKYTARALFGMIRPKIDLVFTRELKFLDLGVETSATASDHLPVWLELEVLGDAVIR